MTLLVEYPVLVLSGFSRFQEAAASLGGWGSDLTAAFLANAVGATPTVSGIVSG
jgi:aspartokinase